MHRKKSYTIPKRALLFWGLVGVIAAGAAGITAFAAPGTMTTALAPSTATASSHLGARPKETPANNPNFPFATDAMLPPTLAASLHGEATEVARGYLRLTQEPGLAAQTWVLPTQAPTPAPRGIVNGTGNNEQLSPYLRMMDITNHWEGMGKDPAVITGALLTDPRQGVTVLAYGQRNSSLGDTKVFPTPTKHGAVRITAVNGSMFTLTAADGTVFTFDIKAMTYR